MTNSGEARTHTIVVNGDDGSTWTYHAVCGDEVSAPETGWVLVIEGGTTGMEPQALTADEVLGDLYSMMPGEATALPSVQVMTEAMIEQLNRQARRLDAAGKDSRAERDRVGELRDELTKALALAESDEPPA